MKLDELNLDRNLSRVKYDAYSLMTSSYNEISAPSTMPINSGNYALDGNLNNGGGVLPNGEQENPSTENITTGTKMYAAEMGTAPSGERIILSQLNNQIEFYDKEDNLRGAIFPADGDNSLIIASFAKDILISALRNAILQGGNSVSISLNTSGTPELFELVTNGDGITTEKQITQYVVLHLANLLSEPSGAPLNGMIYYNAISDEFRGYIGGAWKTFTLV